jgi:Ras-related protein Rab-1A
MVSSTCDFNYKILLLGDSSVGKTCFLLRYVEDTFTENFISTIGVDFKTKIINNPDGVIKLQIWDTAGQDRFRSITRNYFRGSNGIMLIYDITNKSSFNSIKNWMGQIKDYLGESANIVLVGNKLDLEMHRKVSTEEGIRLGTDFNIKFYETSVKSNINVNEAFECLTKEMINRLDSSKGADGKRLSKEKAKDKSKCCTSK